MTRDRDELLDHDADGIREFDNDLPRWWLYGFYLTIVFALVYMINFHALANPLFGPPSVIAEYDAEMRLAAAANAVRASKSGGVIAIAALTDHESLEKGRALFESSGNPCFSCHRPDLGGLVGPNLTDNLWLHGCSVADVMTSIRTGYPTRGMLPYGGGTKLSDDQLRQLASYVLSKQGSSPKAPKPADPARDKVCP